LTGLPSAAFHTWNRLIVAGRDDLIALRANKPLAALGPAWAACQTSPEVHTPPAVLSALADTTLPAGPKTRPTCTGPFVGRRTPPVLPSRPYNAGRGCPSRPTDQPAAVGVEAEGADLSAGVAMAAAGFANRPASRPLPTCPRRRKRTRGAVLAHRQRTGTGAPCFQLSSSRPRRRRSNTCTFLVRAGGDDQISLGRIGHGGGLVPCAPARFFTSLPWATSSKPDRVCPPAPAATILAVRA